MAVPYLNRCHRWLAPWHPPHPREEARAQSTGARIYVYTYIYIYILHLRSSTGYRTTCNIRFLVCVSFQLTTARFRGFQIRHPDTCPTRHTQTSNFKTTNTIPSPVDLESKKVHEDRSAHAATSRLKGGPNRYTSQSDAEQISCTFDRTGSMCSHIALSAEEVA